MIRQKDGSLIDGDGVFRFWQDGYRVRWAFCVWPDDGLGIRGHGAAPDLEGAVADAQAQARERAKHKPC